MDVEKAIDEFFAGKRTLFFLVTAEKPLQKLTSKDFAKQKQKQGLGIVCWTNLTYLQADRTFSPALSFMSPIELSASSFNDLMERNDPDRLGFDGFTLLR